MIDEVWASQIHPSIWLEMDPFIMSMDPCRIGWISFKVNPKQAYKIGNGHFASVYKINHSELDPNGDILYAAKHCKFEEDETEKKAAFSREIGIGLNGNIW